MHLGLQLICAITLDPLPMPSFLANRLQRFFRRFFPAPPRVESGHQLELVFEILWYRQNPPCIVQIGASDGSLNDPLADFLATLECRAVLVEPLPEAFRQLSGRHAARSGIVCRQVAIDRVEGKRALYTITDDCPYMGGQLTSFSRDHLLKNGVKPRHIKTIEVPTMPLSRIVSEAGIERVDLLQVDTEGFDDVVVRMALGLPVPPRFINFEHLHLSKEAERNLHGDLRSGGYSWVKGDWDTLAWKQKEPPADKS
jgi:FkbM family methyltransferase